MYPSRRRITTAITETPIPRTQGFSCHGIFGLPIGCSPRSPCNQA